MKREIRPFYIGWEKEMSREHRSFLKKILIPIFILIPIVAFLMVRGQQPFTDHIFELGKVKEYTGVYHGVPVPILEISDNTLPAGISKYVLLVGFGKYGAEGIINEIEKTSGSLEGQKVTLKGSLIYGDGRAVLELTKKEKSLVNAEAYINTSKRQIESPGAFEHMGEILDPKCYFGVMKPGEGKIHKSCAVRCISGGIPPVFRAQVENGQYFYHILLGPDGEKINREILDKIGENVIIKGRATTVNGWNVVYADPTDIQ